MARNDLLQRTFTKNVELGPLEQRLNMAEMSGLESTSRLFPRVYNLNDRCMTSSYIDANSPIEDADFLCTLARRARHLAVAVAFQRNSTTSNAIIKLSHQFAWTC